jgi:hypothetical protein
MQDSREHAAVCLDRLAAAVSEMGNALACNATEHPQAYLARLENVARRIAEAQASSLSARVEATRILKSKASKD